MGTSKSDLHGQESLGGGDKWRQQIENLIRSMSLKCLGASRANDGKNSRLLSHAVAHAIGFTTD
jgi:hypothetical protein